MLVLADASQGRFLFAKAPASGVIDVPGQETRLKKVTESCLGTQLPSFFKVFTGCLLPRLCGPIVGCAGPKRRRTTCARLSTTTPLPRLWRRGFACIRELLSKKGTFRKTQKLSLPKWLYPSPDIDPPPSLSKPTPPQQGGVPTSLKRSGTGHYRQQLAVQHCSGPGGFRLGLGSRLDRLSRCSCGSKRSSSVRDSCHRLSFASGAIWSPLAAKAAKQQDNGFDAPTTLFELVTHES